MEVARIMGKLKRLIIGWMGRAWGRNMPKEIYNKE
jgi:hypothetical protein